MVYKAGPEFKFAGLWLAVGYALVVLVIVLSLVSAPDNLELSFPYEDKVFHAFAYFTLMTWFSQIYHDRYRRNLAAIMFILLGVILEFLQSFEPSRTAEFADMVANTTGVVLGYLLALTAVRYALINIERRFFG